MVTWRRILHMYTHVLLETEFLWCSIAILVYWRETAIIEPIVFGGNAWQWFLSKKGEVRNYNVISSWRCGRGFNFKHFLTSCASKLLHVKVVVYESPNSQYLHVTTTLPYHLYYIWAAASVDFMAERSDVPSSFSNSSTFFILWPRFPVPFDQDSLQDVSSDSELEFADEESVLLVAVVVVAAAVGVAVVVVVVAACSSCCFSVRELRAGSGSRGRSR